VSKKTAVIGIGNTLRRDDGIGVMVLDSLLKFYKREEADYFNFGSASFDLLHRIKNYDAVLLIDGINANLAAGELKIGKLEDIEYHLQARFTSTHELNLKNIFELSKKLDIKTTIYVAGIQVADTALGEGLSETLKRKEEEITKKVSAFIDEVFI
jgi:hydrogenase maturation protease